ncbi:hypothetical protein [Marinactinospora rubrisoli]|uniref:DUF1902 domain-containing protein n=1 Tax=Marinactinospora rubrisoli TaxID=2715399 RepID=A0ABW2KI10_9ACTN
MPSSTGPGSSTDVTVGRPCYRVLVSAEDHWWVAKVDGIVGAAVQAERREELEDELRDALALLLDIDYDAFDVAWVYEGEHAALVTQVGVRPPTSPPGFDRPPGEPATDVDTAQIVSELREDRL